MIDLVLAGDNAVAVGLAAAGLPPEQRRKAILWGLAAAVTMHRQAEHAPLERVVGVWSELADRKSALRARVANVPKDRLEQAIDALWKEYRA